jgi:hypothetical protein
MRLCRWPIEVLFDWQGKMYMHTGWEKFTRGHNIKVGCLLTFLYEDHDKMTDKVLDKTFCHRNYHTN